MPHDLVIRNGTLIDGSGRPGHRADVAIAGGRIARLGRIGERGAREIDAEGMVVAPGFIDGHTHLDAQVCWDPLGTSACWHGVTTAVMGNCGFTLAPCRAGARELVLQNLERAEDIPGAVLEAGVGWDWEHFSEYLDALDRLPKGINYAGYVGHSALRTFAMGERAFDAAASEDELAAMRRELRDALAAGAIGLSTSRSQNHRRPDDRFVASVVAPWSELRALAGEMGELGAGVFQIASPDRSFSDDAVRDDYHRDLLELASGTGRSVLFGLGALRATPGHWRPWLALIERAERAGASLYAHVHAREFSVVLSFETGLPFDCLPEWRALRALPLDAQRKALGDPETRDRLVHAAQHGDYRQGIGAEARRPEYEWIFPLDDAVGPQRSVAELARERGVEPARFMIERARERDLRLFFRQVFSNEDQEAVLELMQHPRSIVAFSDSGAHVSQIMDSSIPTHLLAHWVRGREKLRLETAVRMLSAEPAAAFGFRDRGLLREGFAADAVVFDPERVAPLLPEVAFDLPGGARRLVQRSRGIAATIVNGEILLRDGRPTGALPGRLLRGAASRSPRA